jgi:hypothetical protein
MKVSYLMKEKKNSEKEKNQRKKEKKEIPNQSLIAEVS